MWNSLIDSDESAQVLTAWIAKEELRSLLALARTGAQRDDCWWSVADRRRPGQHRLAAEHAQAFV
ncbi:MAG: hypothetical protein ACRDST_20885 [Pseudonocardiaceae bacterium]